MQERIKICYILPDYSREDTGHFYHNYELLEELSKKADMFLIVEKSDTRDIKLGNKVYVQRFKFIPFRILESLFVILKARMAGYKNFYTHYCYIGAVNAGIISRLSGGKSYYWNCAMNWLFKKKDISKIGYMLSLKLSHFLVTGSEVMKQGYVEHYKLNPGRVKIMPNWINLERFQQKLKIQNSQPKAGPPRAEKIILFVHWLSKRKGADMIVPIVKNLNQLQTTNYKLLVIGDGPYKEELLKNIKENQLEDYIEVLGGIPNKDLAEYYAKANIFIMPSMEEGFPHVLLEAMASGIPYVASDVGAVREMSPETAQRFLVKLGDVEMFAHKIENLFSDKNVYADFQKEELEKVKEYSMDKIINKFIELFK